jgi:hypothetical protein
MCSLSIDPGYLSLDGWHSGLLAQVKNHMTQ